MGVSRCSKKYAKKISYKIGYQQALTDAHEMFISILDNPQNKFIKNNEVLLIIRDEIEHLRKDKREFVKNSQ